MMREQTVRLILSLFTLSMLILLTGIMPASPASGNKGDVPEKKPLRVAYDPELPPFHFSENGVPRGFSIDLLQAIAEREGYTLFWRPLNRRQSIEALHQQEIDLILGINFMADLDEAMAFTEPYFLSSIALIVPTSQKTINSIMDLSEKVVALQAGTPEFDFLKNIRRVRFHLASTQVDALKLLERQRADAYLGNRTVAEYLLGKGHLTGQYRLVENYPLPLEMSMAVRKEEQSLLQSLNRGLRLTQIDGTYQVLHNRWFDDTQAQLSRRIQQLIRLLVGISILTALVLVGGLYWNRILQQEVSKKTQQLRLVNQSLQEQIRETKNNQQFKEQILDSSPRGLITCDKEGTITSINAVAMDLLGLAARPVGKHYTAFPLCHQLLAGSFQSVIQSGKRYLGQETTFTPSHTEARHPANKTVDLRYSIYPLYDFEHQIIGIILSFEDITEEKKMRASLFEQEKNRALNQLVAGIAHEIRNPLTSIKTFAELLPRKAHQPAFQQEIAFHVPREIDRLNQLIENLIDYARPRKMIRVPIEVASLIHSCLILFQTIIQDKGFHLVQEIEPNLWIEADPSALKQVLINLMLNAIEAMEERALRATAQPEQPLTLTIQAYAEDASVHIQVMDEGIGMDKQSKEMALHPFFTTKPGGTGLGLTLSQQLVQENGGKLFLESIPRTGTQVTVIFPKGGKRDEENADYR